jgi:hypothetical protein
MKKKTRMTEAEREAAREKFLSISDELLKDAQELTKTVIENSKKRREKFDTVELDETKSDET